MEVSTSAPNPTRTHLLQRLIEIQGSQPDRVMAAWLGIEKSYWCRVRRGVCPLTGKAINRALAHDTRELGLLRAHRQDLGLMGKSA